MQNFGRLLLDNTNEFEFLDIQEIFPLAKYRRLSPSFTYCKWAAYIDKYLVFPRRLKKILRQRVQNYDLVHIIDHSNSPYLKIVQNLSSAKCLITCHDLIAIRAALGEFPSAPKTSFSGKNLQRWIRNSLSYADFFACDSEQTENDINRLVPLSKEITGVIQLGTEFGSKIKSQNDELKSDLSFDPSKMKFILHVGSAAWYKNRQAVFSSFLHAKKQANLNDLKLILVGPTPQPHEIAPDISNRINSQHNDIISLKKISKNSLRNLYINAEVLLFPSCIEGFGWPPLEAACVGCPVITTKTGALFDLLQEYAYFVDSGNQNSIDLTLIKCLKRSSRKTPKVSLPTNKQCRENYYHLYRKLTGK